MSQVVSGVTQKLQDLLPNQIGDNARWSTGDVERHIMIADRAVRERTESFYKVASVLVDAGYYEIPVDDDLIDIVSVKITHDDSSLDKYLTPLTLDDLDSINPKWRSDGGAEPDFYVVLGTPGTADGRIVVYPFVTAAVAAEQNIGVEILGHSCGATTTDVPDDVQDMCHVPYVMAILLAGSDPGQAAEWFGQFLAGCEEARKRYRNKFKQATSGVRVGW